MATANGERADEEEAAGTTRSTPMEESLVDGMTNSRSAKANVPVRTL
jgi:hypothetical protein